ncbi:MAG TPA: hypothetical protein VN698_00925 [Bacteroidia bacterium]|nr:hypothetical protein [Bacteroidia bacterium]
MPTNAVILDNAPASCVLAGNDIANGSLFGQRIDPLLAQKIYSTFFVINKIYGLDPTYNGMDAACLYLWELMNKYGIRAMGYSGSGSIIPPTPSGSFTYLIPITGADFSVATNYNNPKIVGKILQIFWNDINRYILSSEYNQTSTGVDILIPGFDATANPTYELLIYIVNP